MRRRVVSPERALRGRLFSLACLASTLPGVSACGGDINRSVEEADLRGVSAVGRQSTTATASDVPSAGTRGGKIDGQDSAGSLYEYRPGSRDGIGKWYMGREISHVMGHLAASWLERPARERQERTDLLIARLPIEPDFAIADIGVGTGYFAFPVARQVPEGRVYAVDIQPEMLDYVRARIEDSGQDNVVPVLGSITDPGLAPASIDLAYIVDAYHEFSHPREMGEALVRSLRPGGRLILIEYRAEDQSVPIKPLHKMTEGQVRREMAAIGLDWAATEDYLPQQHVLIFKKPSASDTPSDAGS